MREESMAQKEDKMKVVKMDKVPKEALINPIFTGREVTRQVLLPESKEYEVNIINFGKGVRNKFHAHDHEQILIVTAGKGVVATETEEKAVTVGDIVLIPAGEKHWHGSAGDSAFSHIFVIRVGTGVTQLED
jgi:quercetin dioxygenase-like cupin family protein